MTKGGLTKAVNQHTMWIVVILLIVLVGAFRGAVKYERVTRNYRELHRQADDTDYELKTLKTRVRDLEHKLQNMVIWSPNE